MRVTCRAWIAVGFRVAHPVAQAVGMRFVYFGYGYVYVEAVIQLFFHVTGLEDDTYGKQVVDFPRTAHALSASCSKWNRWI